MDRYDIDSYSIQIVLEGRCLPCALLCTERQDGSQRFAFNNVQRRRIVLMMAPARNVKSEAFLPVSLCYSLLFSLPGPVMSIPEDTGNMSLPMPQDSRSVGSKLRPPHRLTSWRNTKRSAARRLSTQSAVHRRLSNIVSFSTFWGTDEAQHEAQINPLLPSCFTNTPEWKYHLFDPSNGRLTFI